MDAQTFDKLVVSVATGASRRRLLTGLSALALGALLGRETEAKPSGNKGNSGNSSCAKICNDAAKNDRKGCAGKKSKDKNKCLKEAKDKQATCRAECVPTQNTGTETSTGTGTETGSAPAPESGTDTGAETGTDAEGTVGILAKAQCQKGPAGDAYCQSTVADSDCLKGTCTHKVREGQYRCEYTRQPWLCPGEYCCPYRADPNTHVQYSTSGQCVADETICLQRTA